jgi:hypothetical protein
MPRGPLSPGLPADLVLRSTTPWTAVLFVGMLGGLHLVVAGIALWQGRWEAYFGLGLGAVFFGAAVVVGRVRLEVRVVPVERRVFVRTGVGPAGVGHSVRFDDVRGVRLTLPPGGDTEAKIEILVEGGDIECPPTTVPRQEALLLAMMMDVPLFKVSASDERSVTHPSVDNSRPFRRID